VSIGETLAEARHQAGLTVDQVSQRTRIRPPIIRGIEVGDYSVCGGDFYARGDIRSIAQAVGADPGPLIAEYDQDHRATGPIAATSLSELLARSQPERRRPPDWTLLVALVLVAVAGFGAYYFLARPSPGGGHASVAADRHAGHGPAGRPHAGGSVNAHGASPVRAHTAAPSPSASTAAPSAAPSATPPATRRVLTPVSADAFGPGGPGTGDDPQQAGLAIDAAPGTAWRSDWYTTAQFGNLYGGTGLMLDMGHPVTVSAVRVHLGPASGASFQIRIGNAPVLSQLPPVATSSGPGGLVRLPLASPAQGRYVLVWFTRLPPDPAGTYEADVYNVRVLGPG
jgi:hypothetical protein